MKFFFSIIFLVVLASCSTLDVYEKTSIIKNQTWYSNDTCTVNFNITDTASFYNFYFVCRHLQQYPYRNIYLQIQVNQPDTSFLVTREFQLADNSKWLGTTIDDITEHRILFNNQGSKLKKGNYTFKINQIMREDPLPYLLNAGIRIEKIK
ncbi:MAG: gliding motility lipoprotein GldH [Chitinophagaceae bacterium]|jgi:gliding motility-associated lipoprotein GldH